MTRASSVLRDIGACAEAITFAERYESPQAAWDACESGAWMEWLLDRLEAWPEDGRAEYERVTTAAWAEYGRVRALALAEYERVTTAAWAEYGRVRALALAEYGRVTTAAWAEYGRVTTAARAEYERVRALALAEYERVTTAALAEYERVRALALRRLVPTVPELLP